jgi:hypothetical protein
VRGLSKPSRSILGSSHPGRAPFMFDSHIPARRQNTTHAPDSTPTVHLLLYNTHRNIRDQLDGLLLKIRGQSYGLLRKIGLHTYSHLMREYLYCSQCIVLLFQITTWNPGLYGIFSSYSYLFLCWLSLLGTSICFDEVCLSPQQGTLGEQKLA